MRVLIMDRDRLSTQLITNKLEKAGHEMVIEPAKREALQRIEEEHFDVMIVDPAPLPSAKPIAMSLRRMDLDHYVYMLLTSHKPVAHQVVRMGLNDYIAKPLDPSTLKDKMGNAERLINFNKKLRDESVDIRTKGEVFGKRPYVQLFLSALDRANRYSEQAFMLTIQLNNSEQIANNHGQEDTEELFQKISKFLSKLRRGSDFLGRTAPDEHCLLMQRPAAVTEPVEAAERFILAMREFETRPDIQKFDPQFQICLIELPSGEVLIDQFVPSKSEDSASALA